MCSVTPMDRHGFFSLSCGTGTAQGILEQADIVIVEVNECQPHCFGTEASRIHISDVDFIVEAGARPLAQLPAAQPTEVDRTIANLVVAVLAPILGAVGDFRGMKKKLFKVFSPQ